MSISLITAIPLPFSKRAASPICIGFLIFALSFLASTMLIKGYAQQRLTAVVDATQAQRTFQGLILDGSGLGSLILNVLERQEFFFVNSIRIEPMSSGQVFETSSQPRSISFLHLPFQRFRLETQIRDVRAIVEITSSLTLLFIQLFVSGFFSSFTLFFWITSHRWNQKNIDLLAAQKFNLLAAQVSHDIRSPLASLLSIIADSSVLDSKVQNQIRTSVSRISDIANHLLIERRGASIYNDLRQNETPAIKSSDIVLSNETRSVELLPMHIRSIVSEKFQQNLTCKPIELLFKIDPHATDVFVEIQVTELHRLLSNLINNSVEAIADQGLIQVSLNRSNDLAVLTITDNGGGVPDDILKKLGKESITFGKTLPGSGSGLGVLHAQATIESWGGQMDIKSNVKTGTEINITLPLQSSPRWYSNFLQLTENATVVILSENPSFLALWENRLFRESLVQSANIRVLPVRSGEALLDYYRKTLGANEGTIYLCDYELSDSQFTGLEIIEMLSIGEKSALFIDDLGDSNIIRRCEKHGIKVIPNFLFDKVIIKIIKP